MIDKPRHSPLIGGGLLAVLSNHNKVVSVSQVPERTNLVAHEPIQLVEIDVGEYLASQIANRNSERSLPWL